MDEKDQLEYDAKHDALDKIRCKVHAKYDELIALLEKGASRDCPQAKTLFSEIDMLHKQECQAIKEVFDARMPSLKKAKELSRRAAELIRKYGKEPPQ